MISKIATMNNIKRVSFQLSNICNYAHEHKKCPLHFEGQKTILPTHIVESILEELGEHNFNGIISFHVYNEPTNDPRLFLFIQSAKQLCPGAKVLIWTNGFYLNETIFKELKEIGVDSLYVSAYSNVEYNRLCSLDDGSLTYQVSESPLDGRLGSYDAKETGCCRPCLAPLNDICIAPTGEVFLCCYDWRRDHVFGNLNNERLIDIVNSPKAQEVPKGSGSLLRPLKWPAQA